MRRMVTLNMPDELVGAVDRLAASESRSRSNMVTVLLRQALSRTGGVLLERADALAAQLSADPVVSAMGPPSRSGVLRLAIALGLEVLERDPARARP